MELIITKLLGFILVLTRVSAFFLVTPVFSSQVLPARIKTALVLLLSIFFASVSPCSINFTEISELESVFLICSELIYGLALGLITVFIYSAVKLAGQMIEREMGLSMAEVLDPMTGENAESISILLDMLFILFFLSANGHQMLLLIMSKSFQAFPAGNIASIFDLVHGIINAGSIMLMASLRLAAPMLCVFILVLVVLAVFSRLMPDMDILFISMPLRVGMGLLMLGLFLPFVNQFMSEFADWMGKLIPL